MIDPNNVDLVHHLVLYECDQTVKFDDNNLPDGVCDDYYREFSHCLSNTATVWEVGGEEIVEFPTEAGYPVGGDFGIKYYVIEMHYNNPKLIPNRRDNTGIRFYIGKELRQYDLGYLAFGTSSNALALTIPPKVDQFIVDSYCPSEFSKNFPESGITVVSALLHAHLQGRSLGTKLIRNNTAVEYLFNAERYDFNYQFDNRLSEPIQLYPGDEFATRCVYNTMNKSQVTLGGQRTTDEMCSQIFTYYPRVKDLYGCFSMNHPDAWQAIRNRVSNDFNNTEILDWIKNIEWTPTVAAQWQEFYNDASRMVTYSGFGENGKVYEGRGWNRQAAHSPGWNDDAFGICIMGDFRTASPNEKALNAVQDYYIITHRQSQRPGYTECPGNGTMDVVNKWPRYCSFQNPGTPLDANETLLSLANNFCGKEVPSPSSASTYFITPVILFFLLLIYAL
ncbi:unnamed protein product [Rotaria magnacalcarata]|nr:unnamed protein product [Rotaria magnacalcarata]